MPPAARLVDPDASSSRSTSSTSHTRLGEVERGARADDASADDDDCRGGRQLAHRASSDVGAGRARPDQDSPAEREHPHTVRHERVTGPLREVGGQSRLPVGRRRQHLKRERLPWRARAAFAPAETDAPEMGDRTPADLTDNRCVSQPAEIHEVASLSDAALTTLLERLDAEERLVSMQRRRLHDRIDSGVLRSEQQLSALRREERALSDRRLHLHQHINELRIERSRRITLSYLSAVDSSADG